MFKLVLTLIIICFAAVSDSFGYPKTYLRGYKNASFRCLENFKARFDHRFKPNLIYHITCQECSKSRNSGSAFQAYKNVPLFRKVEGGDGECYEISQQLKVPDGCKLSPTGLLRYKLH